MNNTYKVLATGKKISEEQMTAQLTWLLDPKAEHGLGVEVLSRFIKLISNNTSGLNENIYNQIFANRNEGLDDYSLVLEEQLPKGRLDLLISMNGWKIGIENKIYNDAADNSEQLNMEYSGLITKYSEHKCALVYLVPTNGYGALQNNIKRLLDSFDYSLLRSGEFLKVITWQENELGHPSISSLIQWILHDEKTGRLQPLNDEVRLMLISLAGFIDDNFSGYPRYRSSYSNEHYISTDEILNKVEGFVGVQGWFTGLIKLSAEEIRRSSFKFNDYAENNQWISVDEFRQIYNYKAHGTPHNINWEKKEYNAKLFLFIVSTCSPDQSFFVGMSGGASKLRELSKEKILKKETWWLSDKKEKGRNWMCVKECREILQEKGVLTSMVLSWRKDE